MDGPGGHHPEWGNPITKELTWYAFTDKWLLAQKLISKLQFSKYMKLKKKEDQSVDTSFLLRMGNKIPMGGVTETKFGAETEERTIQRLPHLGIHPIYNHQTQTLLHMSLEFFYVRHSDWCEVEPQDTQDIRYNLINTWNSRRMKTEVWTLCPSLKLGTKHPWKELQRQSLELRWKDGPCRDCHIQGSTP